MQRSKVWKMLSKVVQCNAKHLPSQGSCSQVKRSVKVEREGSVWHPVKVHHPSVKSETEGAASTISVQSRGEKGALSQCSKAQQWRMCSEHYQSRGEKVHYLKPARHQSGEWRHYCSVKLEKEDAALSQCSKVEQWRRCGKAGDRRYSISVQQATFWDNCQNWPHTLVHYTYTLSYVIGIHWRKKVNSSSTATENVSYIIEVHLYNVHPLCSCDHSTELKTTNPCSGAIAFHGPRYPNSIVTTWKLDFAQSLKILIF